ncbi:MULTISPECIES: M20/M25/M40 family metallo-hydrolase [unclassified Chelatococcus]|uniref:M20/M25/M40 family metallo-hydrolase n=1 Tax=unclassified Chelatococcus TaxID=2638111 RepID=UPI001BD0CA30|nr:MULTISPECIES: M20/M25/M40 family metallo-hydrolase [unclassified Chelatococcus]CAH1672107.1 M20_dimer domain-containing protein [Hyphomicrobiales bacterium]MBS7738550.1 M20/M25/M40 family metallo-hydrolase [Chelatococcus sp. HY11]MBX3542954.1 M20/M25/M40 family metallo-hydrolase [Chelatococcus sp.]MCO5076919.1 M20/M25/M40 family metallo-hydrolase [Chelatococcus sp.]CAH1675664.1 M20_dimer domain-containing protein [Hyphomicrobiales bacterium]
MSSSAVPLDVESAVDHLMRFLSVEGVTGQEANIAAAVSDALKKAGVPASAIRFDDVNKRIPLPTETGNLIVDLPGTRPGPRLLFSTHLDTVPLCAGVKPRREGDRIVSDGTTALGGDARTGVALLVVLAETLIKNKLPHPPITLLFTVREESGLHGARELNPADLGGAVMCINVDGQLASELIVGAVGQENWEVEITGKASHAGVAPDKGISATLVGAIALAEAQQAGWFGKVVKPDGRGTSNVGIFGGRDGKPAGDATNVVTDYAYIRGEARSPDASFATSIAEGYKQAFAKAQGMVKDHDGQVAEVKFSHKPAYPPFELGKDAPVVKRAARALGLLGIEPTYLFSNGGLDANWLDKHGVPTVTIGAGQAEIHTIREYVNLDEYEKGCRLGILMATLED